MAQQVDPQGLHEAKVAGTLESLVDQHRIRRDNAEALVAAWEAEADRPRAEEDRVGLLAHWAGLDARAAGRTQSGPGRLGGPTGAHGRDLAMRTLRHTVRRQTARRWFP